MCSLEDNAERRANTEVWPVKFQRETPTHNVQFRSEVAWWPSVKRLLSTKFQ